MKIHAVLSLLAVVLLVGCANQVGSRPSDENDRPNCPKCKSAKVILILYGYPTPQAVKARERGEIELAGCSIFEDAPGWRCNSCGNAFGKISTWNPEDKR